MDDFSPVPHAPALERTEEEIEQVLTVEDKKIAEAYFHPAWAKVEQMFIEVIEASRLPVDSKLPAEEYKITGIANEQVANRLIQILGRVKDAVEATEKGK